MIKLFEDFENDVFKLAFESNSLLTDFMWNIKDFFEDILLSGHYLTIVDHTPTLYLDVNTNDSYLISTKFTNCDYLAIFFTLNDEREKKYYPLLLEYLKMEIAFVFPDNFDNKGDGIRFLYKNLPKKQIDKINFSKKNYEEFLDSERFGL